MPMELRTMPTTWRVRSAGHPSTSANQNVTMINVSRENNDTSTDTRKAHTLHSRVILKSSECDTGQR